MKFIIMQDQAADEELSQRVKRLQDRPIELDPVARSVHFLRGVHSRASFLATTFYSFLGASSLESGTPVMPGYPGVAFKHFIHHSSLASLTLDCRKAFDHRPSGLTGAAFGKTHESSLSKHADYWANHSNRPHEEAISALRFLQTLFSPLSRPNMLLLVGSSELEQRVGLIKYHADRSAAHLSLDDHVIHLLDLAHMVASLTFIGEIIRSFDEPSMGPTRFNDLATAGAQAALALFPDTVAFRMFDHMDIASHAQRCWKDPTWGLHYITRQLPFATGWA